MSLKPICANVTNPDWPEEWPKGNALFGLVTFALNISMTVIGLLLFYLRRGYQPLRNRQKVAIAFSAIGTWTVSIAVSFREYIGRDVFPCDLYLWTIMLAIPSVAGPIVVRLQALQNRVRFQREIVGLAIDSDNLSEEEKDLTRSKFLASRVYVYRALLGMMVFFMLIVLLYFILSDVYGNGCLGCDLTVSDSAFFAGMVGIIACFVLYQLYTIRKQKIKDDTNIMHELKVDAAGFFVGMTSWFVLHTLDPGNLHVNGVFSWSHTIVITCMLFNAYQVIWLGMKTFNVDWCGSRPCNAGNSDKFKGSLEDLLADSEGRRLFELFLQSEFSAENLRFWAIASDWRNGRQRLFEDGYDRTHGGSVSSESKRIASEIYRFFIKPHAVFEINLMAKTRADLRKAFQPGHRASDISVRTNNSYVPDDDLPLEVFDVAIEEVYQLMSVDAFQRFRLTSTYEKYLASENIEAPKVKAGTKRKEKKMQSALTSSSMPVLENEPLI